jgi:hypothetical protein
MSARNPRKPRWVPGFLTLPQIEVSEHELQVLYRKIAEPAGWPMPSAFIGAERMADFCKQYYLWAKSGDEAPRQAEMRAYVASLRKPLLEILHVLRAPLNDNGSLVSHTRHLAVHRGIEHVTLVPAPGWEAYGDFFDHFAGIEGLSKGAAKHRWHIALQHLAPERMADPAPYLADEARAAAELRSHDMLLRALAGLDALLLLTKAAETALKAQGAARGRPSEKQFRQMQFQRLLILFRQVFGKAPESTRPRDGAPCDGSWHIWVVGALGLARDKLKNAGLEKELLPKVNDWANRVAHDWLKENQEKPEAQAKTGKRSKQT